MTLDEYQAEARRTATRSQDAYPVSVQAAHDVSLNQLHDTLIWALGLAGEAGEVCDLLKKTHGHGKPYEADKLKKELGDVLWYLANLATAHGFSLGDVALTNVRKLQTRYPVGFTVEAAAAKADEASCYWCAVASEVPRGVCVQHPELGMAKAGVEKVTF